MKYILLYVWFGTHGVGTMTQKNMTLDECNKLKQIVLQFIIDQKNHQMLLFVLEMIQEITYED